MNSLSLFIRDFVIELIETNKYIFFAIIPLSEEFIFHSYGLLSLVLGYTLAFASTGIIRLSEKLTNNLLRKLLLVLSYILAIGTCFTPAAIPFKAIRFLLGLYNFTCFMSLHSRIMNTLQAKKKINDIDNSDKNCENDNSKDSFYGELATTYLFNVRPRLTTDKKVRHLPTFKRIVLWVTQAMALDLAFYIMLEWIPENISKSNQYAATALFSGLWIMFLMSFIYSTNIVFMAVGYNSSLPAEMRHCHPLLSASISQFWGERWNPVIGKLLQESFYKPVRRLGVPRALCVISCFIGSSALHAIPQFLATHDFEDFAMMGSFFFIHGLFVLAEQTMLLILGSKYILAANINAGSKNNIPIVRAKYQYLSETLTVLFIIILFYSITEKALPIPLYGMLTTLGLGATLFTLHVHSEIEGRGQLFPPALRSLSIWLGWTFTLIRVIITMPLFSMPVFNACTNIHKQSYVTGPFIRTLQQHNII